MITARELRELISAIEEAYWSREWDLWKSAQSRLHRLLTDLEHAELHASLNAKEAK